VQHPSSAASFGDALQAVLSRWSPRARAEVLEPGWERMVDWFALGYDDILDEYDFDLQFRDSIQYCLDAPELQAYPEFASFAQRIAAIDDRFRQLLHPTPLPGAAALPWWRAQVVRTGNEVYARDVMERYGIAIEVTLV
jgi:hypothetical protein